MLLRAEIEAGLPQFIGTGSYWIHQPGLVLTDGANWLAESAECYWLYDIIWSVRPKLEGEGFACLDLAVDLGKHKGAVVIEDGNGRALYRQRIPYTDFPLPNTTLYICDGEGGKKVVMLPSEY